MYNSSSLCVKYLSWLIHVIANIFSKIIEAIMIISLLHYKYLSLHAIWFCSILPLYKIISCGINGRPMTIHATTFIVCSRDRYESIVSYRDYLGIVFAYHPRDVLIIWTFSFAAIRLIKGIERWYYIYESCNGFH